MEFHGGSGRRKRISNASSGEAESLVRPAAETDEITSKKRWKRRELKHLHHIPTLFVRISSASQTRQSVAHKVPQSQKLLACRTSAEPFLSVTHLSPRLRRCQCAASSMTRPKPPGLLSDRIRQPQTYNDERAGVEAAQGPQGNPQLLGM